MPHSTTSPHCRRLVTAIGALALLVLVVLPTDLVGAHGELVAQSPAPGEDVGSVAHIDLVFSTPVFDWSLDVERPDGQPLDGFAVQKADSFLSYEVAPLSLEGQYIVRYSATDTDGDLVEGAYAFSFVDGAPAPAELPVDLAVLAPDESTPWWFYALLFAGVVVIAVLAGLLAEKIRRLRAIERAA